MRSVDSEKAGLSIEPRKFENHVGDAVIDFDTVINMESFQTPHYGYFTTEYYNRIVAAFRAIGDAKDADVLSEAGKLDLYYETLLNAAKGTEKWNVIYDEFSSKLDKLEEKLYLSTEFDVWSMLYEYLDRQIKLL